MRQLPLSKRLVYMYDHLWHAHPYFFAFFCYLKYPTVPFQSPKPGCGFPSAAVARHASDDHSQNQGPPRSKHCSLTNPHAPWKMFRHLSLKWTQWIPMVDQSSMHGTYGNWKSAWGPSSNGSVYGNTGPQLQKVGSKLKTTEAAPRLWLHQPISISMLL